MTDRERAPTDRRAVLYLLAVGGSTPAAAAKALGQPRASVSRAFGRLRDDGLVAPIEGGSAYVLTVDGYRYARGLLSDLGDR